MKTRRTPITRLLMASVLLMSLLSVNSLLLTSGFESNFDEATLNSEQIFVESPYSTMDQNETTYEDQDDDDEIGETEDDDFDEPEDDETDEQDVDDDEDEESEDSDNDEISDDVEDDNERELEMNFEPKHAAIESQLKNGDNKDKIKLEVETGDDGIKIKVEYSSESESSETELEFKVKFQTIYEFTDVDGNLIFNESIDEIEQEYRLENFTPIQYSPMLQPDNSTLHYFNASTADGVFTVHFYLSEEFQSVQEQILTPTEMKFDIEILDFPYQSPTSLLALHTKLEAEVEYEEEDETEDEENGYAENEKGVSLEMNGQSGFFSWAEYANIDGVDQLVTSSPVEEDDDADEQEIYLNYAHGDRIYHDPKMGVKNILTLPEATTGPLGGLLDTIPGYSFWMIAVAIGVGAVAILKKFKGQRE